MGEREAGDDESAGRGPATAEEVGVAQQWIAFSERKYVADANPLYAWEAYLQARGADLPVPDWVLEYFDRVAHRFAHMAREAPQQAYVGPERRLRPTTPRHGALGPERRFEAIRQSFGPDDPIFFTRPEKGEVAKSVFRAMEFATSSGSGPANPFRAVVDSAHDAGLACAVDLALRSGHTLDVALDLVARDHPASCHASPRCSTISRSTVERVWRAHRQDDRVK